MTGKKIKVAGDARATFADNLKRLIAVHYATSTNKPKSLASDAGVTLSTVQRALSAETAPTLDTVEAISKAFGLEPYQTLVVGLNIEKPQAVPDSGKKKKAA